jgi:hypothetical protein
MTPAPVLLAMEAISHRLGIDSKRKVCFCLGLINVGIGGAFSDCLMMPDDPGQLMLIGYIKRQVKYL